MMWQMTPYTVPLLIAGTLLLLFDAYLIIIAARRDSLGTPLAIGLVSSVTVWMFAHTAQLSVTTFTASIQFATVEYVGILGMGISWLAYVLWYTGNEKWLTWRVFGPVAVFALFVLGAVATNHLHQLYWYERGLIDAGSYVYLHGEYGPLFPAFAFYIYGILIATTILLARMAASTRNVFRGQVLVLLAVSVIPGVVGLLHMFDLTPFPGLNLTALSTVLTAVGGGMSVLRFGWLDLTPVTRDRVFETMAEGLVVLDEDRRVVDVNDHALALFEAERETLLGTTLEDTLPVLAETIERISTEDEREELHLTQGDDERVLEVAITTADPTSWVPNGTIILLHDITERKRAEQELTESRQKVERLHAVARDLAGANAEQEVYQHAVDGISRVFDIDGCQFLRAEAEELVPTVETQGHRGTPRPLDRSPAGRAYRADDAIVIDDVAETTELTDGGMQTEPTAEEVTPNDAAIRSLLVVPVSDVGVIRVTSRRPGHFGDDDAELLELLATHVTTALDRLAAEADIRRERDRLDEFASVVSHDLRNPLNVAAGHLDLAQREVESEHLEYVDEAHDRMEQLIDDLLTLAREGQTIGDTQPVDVGVVAEDAWRTVDAPEATLDVKNPGTYQADRDRLMELLTNLFSNAVEHGHEDVTVRVGSVEGGYFVADDGPGIPAEKRDQVFERGHTTSTEGTGFGLAIVQRIAEAHGWDVQLAEGEAGGARFEFTCEDASERSR